ncbi:MAG: tRNA dihydrouridine synthase DusB [Clostridia bacterium]|nr:tRNA dihydrouridine synthase DusB [Clostridia bacterium]
MQIKNLKFDKGIFLAPMAGVTDYSMRVLCHRMGAEMSVTEMLSAKALHYGDEKTEDLAKFDALTSPCSIQIFGHEPDIMAEAAAMLEKRFQPHMIDVNMGCPVKIIVSNGEGSALMKDSVLAEEIVKTVSSAIKAPLSVKIRAGWDENSKNAVYFALRMEKAGADMITVHGRTKSQMYNPGIDLDIIKDVKSALSVPVLGNGDIYTAADAVHMLEYTGCDGVMVARGAYGNPWIFKEIGCALEGKEYNSPSVAERIAVAKEHLSMLIADKGEYTGIREARKHLAWYLKGMRSAATARVDINHSESADEVVSILDRILTENEKM